MAAVAGDSNVFHDAFTGVVPEASVPPAAG